MNLPLIPIPILLNLRCGHCRRFVTCGPVHVTPDSSILCGRCIRFAKRTYRNYSFEAVASLYRYPCHYWPQHCDKKLAWNDSLDHERNCIFKSGCNVFCSKPGTFFKSERKLPNNPEIALQQISEDLLEKLKCLACESYLSNSPVFLVDDGKNVCHRCCHSNGAPKRSVRNLALETIAGSVIFPCIYRFRGCTIRMKFGRELWGHENTCSFGQISNKISKKPTKIEGGKERGVIETHSGHIWGTITPHSALFAPKGRNTDGKIVTQELTQVMKKKHMEDESKGYDAQSMDSMTTFDSLADNVSRSTGDNISRDNISRSTVDNISRDNVSRSSARPAPHDYRHVHNEMNGNYRASVNGPYPNRPGPSNYDIQRPYPEEVTPLPTPTGYNKIPFNGYYQENVARYGRPSHFEQYPHLYHYPPIYYDNNANLNHSNSFNYGPPHAPLIAPKRVESFRIGNQELIEELKTRNYKKQTSVSSSQKDENPYNNCNNLQEIVQAHDEVFK